MQGFLAKKYMSYRVKIFLRDVLNINMHI